MGTQLTSPTKRKLLRLSKKQTMTYSQQDLIQGRAFNLPSCVFSPGHSVTRSRLSCSKGVRPASAALSHAGEWEDLDVDVLRPSRSSAVCITCQHFRYEVGKHCVTLLTCPIHQGLIPQGEHLTTRCHQWMPRQEVQRW